MVVELVGTAIGVGVGAVGVGVVFTGALDVLGVLSVWDIIMCCQTNSKRQTKLKILIGSSGSKALWVPSLRDL